MINLKIHNEYYLIYSICYIRVELRDGLEFASIYLDKEHDPIELDNMETRTFLREISIIGSIVKLANFYVNTARISGFRPQPRIPDRLKELGWGDMATLLFRDAVRLDFANKDAEEARNFARTFLRGRDRP